MANASKALLFNRVSIPLKPSHAVYHSPDDEVYASSFQTMSHVFFGFCLLKSITNQQLLGFYDLLPS